MPKSRRRTDRRPGRRVPPAGEIDARPVARPTTPVDIGRTPVEVRPRPVQKSAPVTVSEDQGIPQGLTTTFWFDSGHGQQPYSATVRFSGRRAGVIGPRGRGDEFVKDESIGGVVPNSGPVSVTTRVHGINEGEWVLTALLLDPQQSVRDAQRPRASPHRGGQALEPAAWSWRRWTVSNKAAGPVKSRYAPLTGFDGMPAVIPGSYPGLIAIGVGVGVVLQSRLLAHEHVGVSRSLSTAALTVLLGLIGAKLWFMALDPKAWRTSLRIGWCIQGFLAGAAVALASSALAILHLSIGVVLDATAPGLFVGAAVGRIGCFLTGCCAGRHTCSRWAIWSSDRRVGARRVPTQLLESVGAAVIGVTGWVAFEHARLAVPGGLFVASLAAYTVLRQGLLRLRAQPRKSSVGGPVTAAVAAFVFLADLVLMIATAR